MLRTSFYLHSGMWGWKSSIHYIIVSSVLRQIHSLFQSQFSRECELVLSFHIPVSSLSFRVKQQLLTSLPCLPVSSIFTLITCLIFNVNSRWGEWSTSRPGPLNPDKRSHGVNWLGGLVRFGDGLDVLVDRKATYSQARIKPRFLLCPVLSLFSVRIALSRIKVAVYPWCTG